MSTLLLFFANLYFHSLGPLWFISVFPDHILCWTLHLVFSMGQQRWLVCWALISLRVPSEIDQTFQCLLMSQCESPFPHSGLCDPACHYLFTVLPSFLTLLEPHWPPCGLLHVAGMPLLPFDFCTGCYSAWMLFPNTCVTNSCTSFKSFLKCHLPMRPPI